MNSDAISFTVIIALIGAIVLMRPVVSALADRLRHRGVATGDVEPLQAQVDAMAQELEQHRRDMADLQERVDFAERVLAKQQDAERLPPPR